MTRRVELSSDAAMSLLLALAAACGAARRPPLMPALPPVCPIATPPAADALVARSVRATIDVPPLVLSRILVGSGWGCASFNSTGLSWQCWDAAPTGREVRAWNVPWMAGTNFEAGPDRVCAVAAGELRCWQRPRAGDRTPHELAPGEEWLNPRGSASPDPLRSDRVERLWLGAGSACLGGVGGDMWCIGDNRYGQRGAGGGGSGPGPDFLHLAPVSIVEVGPWHACARRQGSNALFCWGRDDYGQLGAPAPDVCAVGTERVACAKTPQKVLLPDLGPFFAVGDLFTCTADPKGIACWGASRDGFFGSEPCPARLRQAWPTLQGPVPAPGAKCSSMPVPVLRASGMPSWVLYFQAGPRGLCALQMGGMTCSGAVPTPLAPGVHVAGVSPGDDASACGIDISRRVLCWGEAYSLPSAPGQPVRVVFEAAPAPGHEAAVVDSGPEQNWSEDCLIHRSCRIAPAALPACPACFEARAWSEIAAAPERFTGQIVSVRGPLGVSRTHLSSLLGCERIGPAPEHPQGFCCNDISGGIVLGGGADALAVAGMGCGGDESRLCCNAPAFGQSVVVTGRLGRSDDGIARWKLFGAQVCVDTPGAAVRAVSTHS
jgi:hypothetical protein